MRQQATIFFRNSDFKLFINTFTGKEELSVMAIYSLVHHLRAGIPSAALYDRLKSLCKPSTAMKVIKQCNRPDQRDASFRVVVWRELQLLSTTIGQLVSTVNIRETYP